MLYNVYTTLLAVVSVPILYWTGILVKKIIYIARCRHSAAKLPGMPLLPLIGNLHQVKRLAKNYCTQQLEIINLFIRNVQLMYIPFMK